jgi:hypothetical protein
MKNSLVVYSPPVVDIALFIQRVLLTFIIIVCTIFFNKNLLNTFAAGPALVQIKNERISEEIAVLRNEFFSLLLEIRDMHTKLNKIKTQDMDELREEMNNFSVDVWKEDIADLQEDVYIMKTRSSNYINSINALRAQVDIKSEEIAELRGYIDTQAQEMAILRNKVSSQSKETRDEIALIWSKIQNLADEAVEDHADFKALAWGLHWNGRDANGGNSGCDPCQTAANISEKRGWNHGSMPPPLDNGK